MPSVPPQPPSNSELSPEVLDQYLAGEGTPDDRAAFEAAVRSDPTADVLVRAVRANATRLGDGAAVKARLHQRFADTAPRSAVQPSVVLPRNVARWGTRVLARVGVAAVVIMMIVLVVARTADVSSPARRVTYATKTGERAVVTLADGSHIILAPRSTMVFEVRGASRERQVTLSGEAYFEIASARQAPFVVHTGRVSTRVLGTRFTVRRYASDRSTRVAVLEGRVAIATAWNRSHAVTLAAGMMGETADSSASTITTDDIGTAAAWTTGHLLFHDAPVTDVLAALTRWYGYEFRLADSALARATLTIGVSTESASEALQTLQRTMNVEMDVHGTVITLRPRRAAAVPSRHRLDSRQSIVTFHQEIGR